MDLNHLPYQVTDKPLAGSYQPSSQEIAIAQNAIKHLESGKKIFPYFLEQLENNVDAYPKFLLLKTYLALAYKKAGELENLHHLLEEILEEHPDYLFGRVLVADLYLQDGKWQDAEKLMANFRDVHQLYPQRSKFMTTELEAFHGLAAQYFALKGNYETMQERLDFLKQLKVKEERIKFYQKKCAYYATIKNT